MSFLIVVLETLKRFARLSRRSSLRVISICNISSRQFQCCHFLSILLPWLCRYNKQQSARFTYTLERIIDSCLGLICSKKRHGKINALKKLPLIGQFFILSATSKVTLTHAINTTFISRILFQFNLHLCNYAIRNSSIY